MYYITDLFELIIDFCYPSYLDELSVRLMTQLLN